MMVARAMMTCKQGVDGNMVETLKRKLEEERQKEEEEEVVAEHDRENEEPVKKKIMVEQVILMRRKMLEIPEIYLQSLAISKLVKYEEEKILQKCYECNFKCYSDGEMKTHAITRCVEKEISE